MHIDLRSRLNILCTAPRIECHLCLRKPVVQPSFVRLANRLTPSQAPLHALRNTIQIGVLPSCARSGSPLVPRSPPGPVTPRQPHLSAPGTGAQTATLRLVMEPAEKGQVPRRGFAPRPSVFLWTPYGLGRFKGPVGSPLIASTLTLEASASRSRPHRIVCFRRRAILRRFVPHPRKMANVRRLVLAKASHPHTNRRGRLAPPTAGSAFRVPVSTNASPVRPFQAPRTRLRLEAAFGGRCWRAARVVPGTAIGPGSKFRPDRCRHLLRPLKRGTSLASLARQPFRRARRITGACTRYATPVSAPAKKRKGQVPCHGVASRPSVKSTTIYSPGSSILGGHPIHRYAHRVSLVLPCATFGGPPIIQDEPHAHSSPSATPCASPNT